MNPHLTRIEQHPTPTIPYVLFRLAESVYGLSVAHLREIVLLPELTPVAQQAPWVVGLINLRGSIVPVIDLELRCARGPGRYTIDDNLLILEDGDRQMGVIVNEVMGVHIVFEDQLKPTDNHGSASSFTPHLAQIDDNIVLILDIERLMSSSIEEASEMTPTAAAVDFMRETTTEDQAELRERAERLMPPVGDRQSVDFIPMAVVEIADEAFGLEFEFVREFFEARQVTPVPCCPPHIIGNVNLRGEILTLIDIRQVLNLPSQQVRTSGKVVVVKTEDLEVGVLVDRLYDVVYVPTTDIGPIPSGIAGRGYVKGTAAWHDRMMSVLDLPTLFHLDNWLVDEEAGRIG